MENNDLRKYLERLEDLDNKLNNNSDPNEYIKELNIILNGLSQDVELETAKKGPLQILRYVNKSNNSDPAFKGDCTFDLRAYFTNDNEHYLDPHKIIIISTGLFFEVAKGLEIQLRPRKELITRGIVINTPSIIDSHYHKEVQIIMTNFGQEIFTIKTGDKIAQAVVCPIYGEENLNLIKIEKLSETKTDKN